MWPIPHLMNVWAFLSMGKPPKTMACLHNSRSFILWVPSAPHSSIWVWTKTDNAPYIHCILFRHTLILLAICCITSHHIPLIPYEYPMIHLIVFHDCWFYMSVLMVKIRHFTNFLSFVFFFEYHIQLQIISHHVQFAINTYIYISFGKTLYFGETHMIPLYIIIIHNYHYHI